MAKDEQSKAYKAGYALPSVQWGPDATDEQRTPGVHHSPFLGEGQEEDHAEWCRGLRDALGAPVKDPSEIIKELDEAIGGKK